VGCGFVVTASGVLVRKASGLGAGKVRALPAEWNDVAERWKTATRQWAPEVEQKGAESEGVSDRAETLFGSSYRAVENGLATATIL
jgi:hypothetical protein